MKTETETDGHRDRETNGQTDTDKHKGRDRHGELERGRGERAREAGRQTDRRTDRQKQAVDHNRTKDVTVNSYKPSS